MHPLGLIDKGGTWYLIARPADAASGSRAAGGPDSAAAAAASDTALRSYRVDRLSDPVVLDDVFEPPDGFDLEASWVELSDAVRRARARAEATVLVAPEVLEEFRGWVGGTELVADAAPDAAGRVLVLVEAPSEEALARRLTGWVDGVEVVGPQGVRNRLAAIGARLVEAYAEPDAPV